MVSNVWFDREAGKLVYNIEELFHPLTLVLAETYVLNP
jgi:hypothetical protein